jgi:hypothetical protein
MKNRDNVAMPTRYESPPENISRDGTEYIGMGTVLNSI